MVFGSCWQPITWFVGSQPPSCWQPTTWLAVVGSQSHGLLAANHIVVGSQPHGCWQPITWFVGSQPHSCWQPKHGCWQPKPWLLAANHMAVGSSVMLAWCQKRYSSVQKHGVEQQKCCYPTTFFLTIKKMEQSNHFLHLHFLMFWSTNGIKYHANPLPVSCPSGTPMSSAQGDQEHGYKGCGHPY